MKNRSFLFLVLACAFFPACLPDHIALDTKASLPLAHGRTTLADIVADEDNIKTYSDQSVSIVFRDTLADLQLVDVAKIPDTSANFSFKLDSLQLPSNAIVQRITLGQLAHQLASSSNTSNQQLGQLLLDNQGGTLPFVPASSGLKSDPIPIDATQFFESADLLAGNLSLSIYNGFPLALLNVQLIIGNQSGGTPIVSDIFARVASKATANRNYDLAGKHIESQLSGQLSNLDIEGGILVKVDTMDYIELTLRVEKLKATKATAKFPAQSLIDTVQSTTYNLGDLQLTKLIVASGKIRATATNTIQEPITFSYTLQSSSKNGVSAGTVLSLPAATASTPAVQSQDVPLDGYTIDLTQDPNVPYNTLREKISATTIESGLTVTITQEDNVQVSFALQDIVPQYLEGYMGKQKYVFEGEAALDVFKGLEIGNLSFSKPSASVTFANSIGADARVVVRKIQGENSTSGQRTSLSGSALLAGPLVVLGPNLPDTNRVVETYLPFTNQNSNIVNFLNLRPDKLSYAFDVEANYNGRPFVFDNFATQNSLVRAYLDVEVPIEGVGENIRLQDTLEADFSQFNTEKVQSATITLHAENTFPLKATLTATVLDANRQPFLTLITDREIAAGVADAANRVNAPTKTVIPMSLSKEQLESLSGRGKFIALSYRLDTAPAGKNVKLYSDYGISANLVGEVKVQVGL